MVNHRLQRPLLQLRPKLTSSQRWTLSSAALSVIGSITDHSNQLAAGEIRLVLISMAADVLAAELPASRRRTAPRPEPINVGPEAGMYEHVLYESVRLFYEKRVPQHEHGGHRVGGGGDPGVGGAVPVIPGQGRHPGAGVSAGRDRHSSDTADALSRNSDPEEALDDVVDEYLGRVMEWPDLPYVYYTERHNVPEADLRVLETIESSTMDAWARLVTAARPEMKIGAARYAVGAAFALTVDFRRLFARDSGPESVATIRRLMEVTLLGRPVKRRR